MVLLSPVDKPHPLGVQAQPLVGQEQCFNNVEHTSGDSYEAIPR